MLAIASSADPFHEGGRFSERENALEAKELKLRILPGLFAECASRRMEECRIIGFVDKLGRKKREAVMLTLDVRDLAANFYRIRAGDGALRKQNTEIASEVWGTGRLQRWSLRVQRLHRKSWS